MPPYWRTIALMMVLTSAYAVLRYVVFGTTAEAQVPLFVLNKSLSMSSALALAAAAVNHWQGNRHASKVLGSYCQHLAVLHVLISLALLSPDYYPKLHIDSLLSISGEISLLFGVLTAWLFLLLRDVSPGERLFQQIKLGAAACLSVHLLFLGGSSWLHYETWPANMPPISLLTFLVSLATTGFYLVALTEAKA